MRGLIGLAMLALPLEVLALTLTAPPERRARVAGSAAIAALPGVCLMLAMRAAWQRRGLWVLAGLAASLPAHLADLARRPPG